MMTAVQKTKKIMETATIMEPAKRQNPMNEIKGKMARRENADRNSCITSQSRESQHLNSALQLAPVKRIACSREGIRGSSADVCISNRCNDVHDVLIDPDVD